MKRASVAARSRGKRTHNSKWDKTKLLLRNGEIRRRIPETRRYARLTLRRMLSRYGMVYVKPVRGTQGKGVIRAERRRSNRSWTYRYQLGEHPRKFGSFDRFYASLNRSRLQKPYLIQRGIHLLTYTHRRFDVRIMVQRTDRLPWEATGYIGRLGHPRRIVTNYHSEGRPLPLEQLLSPYMDEKRRAAYIAKLCRMGVMIAKHLAKSYPNFREIGVDLGIDPQFRPWIIEVNTAPDPFIFRELRDKRMLKRVLRRSQANGRYLRTKL